MDNLTLNGSVLAPMSTILEKSIQATMQKAVEENKTGEITLKIKLSTVKRHSDYEGDYLEPIIDYQITQAMKESKKAIKNTVGFGGKIEKDEDGNIYIRDYEG